MTNEEQGKKVGRIISRAWTDEAFKKRLLADATAVLQEAGVSVPEGMTVKAVEDSTNVRHIVIPARPPADMLSDAQLDSIAGGKVDPTCGFVPYIG